MFQEAKGKSKNKKDLIEVEVREDEEQKVKFEEIIEILIKAGYYRARIKGLPNFDKIIGGMIWCIESSSFGVDIHLLFQENLTIGQKIALTEKIVAVLPKMNCPYQIEPHQIQGLDCIHIFPVIKSKSEELMRNLSTFEDESNHLSWNFVEKFVDIQAREIDKVTNKSASSCSQFEDYKTSITTLLKQIFILKNKIEKLIQDKLGLNREVHHVMNHLYEIRNKKIVMNFQIIENLEMHQNKELLRMMEVLLIIYDGLKNQENKFRERCRINLLTLKKLSENTQKEQPYKENNFALEHENQKVVINQLRLQLARKNRLIATLTRQLDDVPCRSELFQYQRRFMELYNEVSTKHKETKQYYTLYNTLDDTKIYLNKELCLLNSIQDSYNQALAYNNGREQFVKQFELIVEGVQRNKIKIQNRCAEGKSRRDICSQQLTILMDQQRKYIAAVRELTTACRENETLLAQLRRL
ncbi:coiled-coil domain-containing protein 93 isoform X5 [Phymastichus coffea]|uniref:coiled-coil domain-containing protein 93 isoform X5 n=1 Tax=Phymastichus coffea TaxID=108790 RepID=UPI00273BBFAA|nr:coiled-coil domain-containing protein 93 isoform X5 [Phymastichus coffea]